jgi:hypothetical protein
MAAQPCDCDSCAKLRKLMNPTLVDANKTAYRLVDLVAGGRLADSDALIGTLDQTETANALRSVLTLMVTRESKLGTDPASLARLRRFASSGLEALTALEAHVA